MSGTGMKRRLDGMKLYLDKKPDSLGDYYVYGYDEKDELVFKTVCQKYEVAKYFVYLHIKSESYTNTEMLSRKIISEIYLGSINGESHKIDKIYRSG